jgi:acetolactate synthase-1/2/3 large subunit
VIVVLNDAWYGNIRQEQIHKYGARTIGVDFGPVDYAKVAEGLGVPSHTATGLEQLGDLVAAGFAAARPTLIDVPINPGLSAWTYPLFRPSERMADRRSDEHTDGQANGRAVSR